MGDVSNQELKKYLLDLLIKFDVFCKENNIQYFLAYGSLLGAVRHKGFIPWDDDIDVLVPRKDCDRLLSFNKDICKDFSILSPYTDKNYFYSFIKISDHSTTVIETKFKKPVKMGLFIDVFPLDNVPDDEITCLKFKQKCRKKQDDIYFVALKIEKKSFNGNWFRRQVRRLKYNFTPKIIKYNIKRFFALFKNPNKMAKNTIKFCAKYQLKNTNRMGVVTDSTRFGYPSDFFLESKKISFCDVLFDAPSKVEQYLTITYGDYMTPPPENEQGGGTHGFEVHINN